MCVWANDALVVPIPDLVVDLGGERHVIVCPPIAPPTAGPWQHIPLTPAA